MENAKAIGRSHATELARIELHIDRIIDHEYCGRAKRARLIFLVQNFANLIATDDRFIRKLIIRLLREICVRGAL